MRDRVDADLHVVLLTRSVRSSRRLSLQRGADRVVLGENAGLQLGIDGNAVHADLEPPVRVRSQAEGVDALFVGGQQIVRQTDGLRFIASRRTVFDTNVHTSSLNSEITRPRMEASLRRSVAARQRRRWRRDEGEEGLGEPAADSPDQFDQGDGESDDAGCHDP